MEHEPSPTSAPTPSPGAAALLAPVARAWLGHGRRALVVRPVGVTELGPLLHGEVLLVAEDGERAGGVLRGAADPDLAAAGARLWARPATGCAVEPVTPGLSSHVP